MLSRQLLRELPSVDEVLGFIPAEQGNLLPHSILVENIREIIADVRQEILSGEYLSQIQPGAEQIANKALKKAQAYWRPNLRSVINATGVVLHTNLGRAVLSSDAEKALAGITRGYSNLELDLRSGERGSRYSHVVELLCRLTGAEAAIVVNNNAAAVLLVLNTLAKGKEAIVSRGQLVEIGGSFRVPEVMAASGTHLVEVGTTNKTYQQDYRKAINSETALILKIHPSNYRITGFTHETSLKELVALGGETGVPVMEDLGSGFLLDLKPYGITGEPTVQEEIKAGTDIVTFSGDKLLGGPQAGIIVGKKKYIDSMAKNQLTRALRVDKLTISALEATLRVYLWEPERIIQEIPILNMLTLKPILLEEKAASLRERLRQSLPEEVRVTIEKGMSQAGGGSLPTLELPTVLVTLNPGNGKVEKWAARLRQGEPAVMARIAEGKLLLDVRTVLEGEEKSLVEAVVKCLPG